MASPTSAKKVEDWTDDAADEYDLVRFTLADMHGIARCKLIPRRHVTDRLTTGITMCSGTVCPARPACLCVRKAESLIVQ